MPPSRQQAARSVANADPLFSFADDSDPDEYATTPNVSGPPPSHSQSNHIVPQYNTHQYTSTPNVLHSSPSHSPYHQIVSQSNSPQHTYSSNAPRPQPSRSQSRQIAPQNNPPNPAKRTSNPTALPFSIIDTPPPQSPFEAALFRHPEYQTLSYSKTILATWPDPQPMKPERARKIREDCNNYMMQIQHMQAELDCIGPEGSQELAKNLFKTRIDWSLIYYQLFRINDLPPEIVANIFRFTVWSATKPEAGVSYRLRLTWVCKFWRSVAIDDSTLWNAIWFRDPPPYSRSLAWFKRAGAAPLDIRISETDPKWRKEGEQYQFTGERMSQLLDVLFTKLSQIRMLLVIVETWPPALMVLDKLRMAGQASIPMTIERFELHRSAFPYVWIGQGYEPDQHRVPMVLFGGAPTPTLRYFSINGVNIEWYKSHLENLTTFDIRRIPLELSPTLSRFRDILRGCPRLEKLSLDGAGPIYEPEEPNIHTPVELPYLKCLVIADYSLSYGLYVLSQFTAPHVLDLTLMNLIGEDYAPLLQLITGAFPEVRLLSVYSLEIDDTPDSRRAIVRWLHSMPELAYLRIAKATKEFLESFLLDAEHPIIPIAHPSADPAQRRPTQMQMPNHVVCPKLVTLECQGMNIGLVINWLLSRIIIGQPIQKLYVDTHLSRLVTPNQSQQLQRLCEVFISPPGAKTPEEDELVR